MPTPIRTVTLLIAFLAVGFYWLMFLNQPLIEGSSEFSRGLFVMSAMLYPEGYMWRSWTDEGRLPLAFFDRLPIWLATLTWLGLATAIGWPWCAARADRPSQNLSRSQYVIDGCLSCLCGLALLSTLTLLIGLAGLLTSRWPLITSATFLALFSSIASRFSRRSISPRLTSRSAGSSAPTISPNAPQVHNASINNPPANNQQPINLPSQQTIFQRVISNAVIIATVWLGAMIMLGAWVPPREFDVVEYHLQAPKEFFQSGRINFVPHNIYANMPLGAEMHALAAMTILQDQDAWLGGLIGKSITAAISVLGALLLGSWIAQRLGRLAGWSAAGIWLGTPGITQVATFGLIDGVLATYVLATALAMSRSVVSLVSRSSPSNNASEARMQVPVDDEAAFRQLRTACFLAGATAALKYPGLIYATVPCLLVCAAMIFVALKQRQSRFAIRVLVAVIVSLSLTCVPWYIKNWALAGNPVYPLAAGIFGGETLTAEKVAQWQAAHRVPPVANFMADLTRLLIGSTFVQPAMIIGVLCSVAWLWRMRESGKRSIDAAQRSFVIINWFLVGWSVWILLVWWLATHRIDRFWLPVTGLWSALAAWGLWQVRQNAPALANTVLLSGLLYAALYCSSPFVTDNRFFVSLSGLRDDIGDENHLPRVPPVQTWINQNLAGRDTRVLMIGEARVFEYRVDVVYSTCFDTNPGEKWLANSEPAEQRAALTAAGVTHVLINWSEIERYRSPGNYGFSDWPQPSHIDQLVRDQILEPIPWDNNDRTQLFKVK